MDHVYSLYDALVSINVPGDRARAVVDAMERHMVTTLVTKADLQLLRQELRSDIQLLRQDNAQIRTEMALLSSQLTVRLGSMLVVAVGVLFAALRLS